MDVDLFRDAGEQFNTFDTHYMDDGYPEDSTSLDGMQEDGYEWEVDRENNGDLATIPISSNFCASMHNLGTSPPFKEDINRLMSDWQQQLMGLEPISDLTPIDDSPFIKFEEIEDETIQQKDSLAPIEPAAVPDLEPTNFDITKYINESDFNQTPPERKPMIGMKKIDLKAQRYIVEDANEEDVDVETVSDAENSPVLEAGDLKTLLEQFEATEMPENKKSSSKNSLSVKDMKDLLPQKSIVGKPAVKSYKNTSSTELATSTTTSDTTKSKQILDALPQELIDRIKESGKRKTISVIPPIPNKRQRGSTKSSESSHSPQKNKNTNSSLNDSIKLDHDYCTSFPIICKKESGFESGEEEERIIVKNQPTVKNPDGKLMVSLLKINNTTTECCIKKKLNLEEYKKRREGVLKPLNSQNASPMTSVCSSPLPEDDVTKRLKHQEKLMKMAKEVLATPPKSEKKSDEPKPTQESPKQPLIVPADMEMKTLVSMGVNTDPILPTPVEELQPILNQASSKINCNSLITSLIENLPKAAKIVPKPTEAAAKKEHGEDKTIVYLPKNREAVKTRSFAVQTNISLLKDQTQNRYRRRNSSVSSRSSSLSSRSSSSSPSPTRYSGRRRRSTSSNSSHYRSRSNSSSSSYSSRSSSRSRSRSISPPRCRRKQKSVDREHLIEVEERRVIYVGCISPSTTREDLKKRFQKFGPITNVSLHFRNIGYLDHYGFVTFANKLDAYEAIEHGNDDPYLQKYDLRFGGRRLFCKTSYSDLDNMREDVPTYFGPRMVEDSFDQLLRDAQEKLRKRKA